MNTKYNATSSFFLVAILAFITGAVASSINVHLYLLEGTNHRFVSFEDGKKLTWVQTGDPKLAGYEKGFISFADYSGVPAETEFQNFSDKYVEPLEAALGAPKRFTREAHKAILFEVIKFAK